MCPDGRQAMTRELKIWVSLPLGCPGNKWRVWGQEDPSPSWSDNGLPEERIVHLGLEN